MDLIAVAPAATTDLVVAPHPLTLAGRTITQGAELRPGDTLLQFLERAGVDLARGGWVVSVGGALVPQMMWSRTRPHHGQVIECRRAVGKQVIAIVAILVLAYFTFGAGLAVGGIGVAAGVGAAGSFAVVAFNAGVYMLGSMIINKVLGPTQAKGAQYNSSTGNSTVYSLSGARNKARPYEPLGLVFGSVRVVPDYAAQPYGWFEGENQIIYVRFQAGINAGAVSQLKIGGTDISAFTDAEVAQSGFPGSSSQLLDWANVDSIAGGALAAPTGSGSYVTRTSSVDTVRLAIDVGAQLYSMDNNGGFNLAQLDIQAELRLLPIGAWMPFTGGSATLTLTSRATKPVRVTYVTGALTAGQYEVRLRKMTADVTATNAANTVEWGSLKSYQLDSGAYTHYPQVGIRIKASGQLNGTLDELTWLLTQQATPLWNGSAWSTTVTSNPGAHILQFARGIYDSEGRLLAGMALPDAQIDIEGLQAFMVHCTANGYRFDHYFDAQLSCGEVLEAMAAAGMGSISHHPGKLSVVWATSSDPVEAVVAMGNIKAGSFNVDYTTRATAEELEVSGLDRDNDWRPFSVRVLAPGVTVPRETARYAPVGQTTQAGLIREARKVMGQNLYGRKSASWEMDLEHLTFRRYSVIALSHDLTQWGYSGRLHSAAAPGGVVTLTLDAEVPFNAGATLHKVGVRVPGETGYRIFTVQTFSGLAHTLTLVEGWPGGVAFPGDSSSNPAHDYVWIYDFKATPGQRMRVVSIEPASNLGGAKITATPETDEFWTYMASGSYTVPASAGFTTPLVVSNVALTQDRGPLNYDLSTELNVSFDVAGNFDHAQVWGGASDTVLELLGETRTRSFGPKRVTFETTYYVEVRPFDSLGRPGAKGVATYGVSLDDPLGLAHVLQLVATTQFFKVNAAGVSTPTSIVLTAVAPGFTGAPTFAVIDGTATLTGTGVARTLTFANLTTETCTVRVTWSGQSDQVTLLKVKDGSGTYSWVLQNESRNIACDAAGTPTAGLPIASQFIVIKDSVLLTSGVAYSVGTVSGFTGVSINATSGAIAITGITADTATAEFIATVTITGGSPLVMKRELQATKIRAGAGGGTGYALEITVYQQALTQPLTPSGGMYTFNTDAFAPPAGGWSRNLPTSSTTGTFASRALFRTTTPAVPVPGPTGTVLGEALTERYSGGMTAYTTVSGVAGPFAVVDGGPYGPVMRITGATTVGPGTVQRVVAVANAAMLSVRFKVTAAGSDDAGQVQLMAAGAVVVAFNPMRDAGADSLRRALLTVSGTNYVVSTAQLTVGTWYQLNVSISAAQPGAAVIADVASGTVVNSTAISAVGSLAAIDALRFLVDQSTGTAAASVEYAALFVAPITDVPISSIDDPLFSTVPLLLKFEGANNSTTTTDSSSYARTIGSFVGTAKISTTNPINGTSSLLLDGTQASGVPVPYAAELNFAGKDFTIEVRAVRTGTTGFHNLVDARGTGPGFGAGSSWTWNVNAATGAIGIFDGPTNAGVIASTPGAFPPGVLCHLMMQSQGGVVSLYVNFQLVATGTYAVPATHASGLRLAYNPTGLGYPALAGRYDDLRVTLPARYRDGGWSLPVKVYQDGASGVSSAPVFLYQRAATTPSLPSALVTYTFATGVATGLTNGWTQTVPAGSNPVYMTLATAVTTTGAATDTIAPGEWAGAQSLGSGGSPGANGINNATVFLFQRTSTATPPSLPSADVTYTFSTAVATGLTSGWAQTLPTTGGMYRWVTTASALAASTADTLSPAEWSGPSLMAQDGTDGTPGAPSVQLKLSADSVSVPADSTGYIASYSMAVTIATVEVGGVVDTGWTFSASFGVGIAGDRVDNQVSITSLTRDYGYVDISATKSGYPVQTKTFTVTRVKSGGLASGDVFGAYFDVFATDSSPAIAGVRFATNGAVQLRQGKASVYSYGGDYFSPPTTGVGADRWIRVTPRSGYSGSCPGTSGAWVSLATAQTFTEVASSPGDDLQSVLDYEISNSSTGTPVVGDGVLEIRAVY